MADLYATRRRRRCQLEEAASGSPLLDRLRRAIASVLRVGRPPKKQQRDEPAVVTTVASNGGGGAIRSNGENGHAAEDKVQWARGKAGEDRVHVVVSEERGWMFVGIYDGFNGPDATDYLVANLYASVCRELPTDDDPLPDDAGREQRRLSSSCNGRNSADLRQRGRHGAVLDALARALRRTEEGYFAEAEARAAECPELAMMGSCVLVLLMKGADVYSMNVGDSRAVLAHRAEPDLTSVIMPPRHRRQHSADGHGHVTEEIRRQFDECDMTELVALQLTMEHSTTAYKEVKRIRSEHLDDPACIVNGRVKGSLKVTRAFGAGYLKEPRWNKALLEVFRVDYVGVLPYITCKPFLRHHCLGPRDKFLILASDGLYEYFTNEEVVGHVEAFTSRFPDEDPAKYLSHEILLRAARQAGMGFHELLEVRQGDRRQYHDDVSIIIISLEGKIWRSSA
uniref:protein-serine/threonine phosphatase n=2 Tax=Triticum urartu TaxID=4572 RepID=A0A8R7NWQ9_TRIUA